MGRLGRTPSPGRALGALGGGKPLQEHRGRLKKQEACVFRSEEGKVCGHEAQWHPWEAPPTENSKPLILSQNLPLGVKSLGNMREQSRSGLSFLKVIIVL